MKNLFLLISISLLCSCGTVTPNYVTTKEIAYSPTGKQDAGILGQVVNTKTKVHSLVIHESDRKELNILISKYGNLFSPALTRDEGLIPIDGGYAIRNDILVDYAVMKSFAKRDAASSK